MTVLRLAQVGFDWTTTNLKNLIYSESTAGYSVRSQVSASLTTSAVDGNGSVSVDTTFGYAPWVEIFVTTKEGFYIEVKHNTTWYGNESSHGVGDYLTEVFDYSITPAGVIVITANSSYTMPMVGPTNIAQAYTFNVIAHMERIDG